MEAILAGERNWQELSLSTNYELLPAIGSSLDNQFYYLMTGRSDFRGGDSPGVDRLSEEEFLRYWHMATLMESVSRGYQTLDFANRLTIPALTARVEETFDTAAQRMERSIEYLEENGGPELNPDVIPLANRLLEAGTGRNSGPGRNEAANFYGSQGGKSDQSQRADPGRFARGSREPGCGSR